MEMTPASVRITSFKTVKKGYDPGEVDSFKVQVAAAIETAQNQATAMEARARAAVSKLQEITQAGSAKEPGSTTPPAGTPSVAQLPDDPARGASATPAATSTVELSSTDAESISRTLLLAQRTADATVAASNSEAAGILQSARADAAKLVEEGRNDGRRANEEARLQAESEVQSLLARRDFLVSDVDHLEQHLGAQRERLRDAAVALHDLVDRVPAGLGEIRRPLLSASNGPSTAAAGAGAQVDEASGGGAGAAAVSAT